MTPRGVSIVCFCFVLWALGTNIVAVASPKPNLRIAMLVACNVGQTSASNPKKVEFTRKGMGEMGTGENVGLPFTTFEASDGVTLTSISGEFESQQRAKQEFESAIAKALKIIKRGAKRDNAGRVVGDRARILLPGDNSDHMISALVWTQGRYFHEIISTSWTDILELAKKYSD